MRQNDEEAAEDGDNVDEEIDAMPNEVVVAVTLLLDDQLGVKQNAAAHHRQSQIQLRLHVDETRMPLTIPWYWRLYLLFFTTLNLC